MKHINVVPCPGCDLKMVGITNPALIAFYQSFRTANPDGHVSCGLRGEAEQEADYDAGTSRAHFGQSAHNFGLALDWFRLTLAGGANFDSQWFKLTLAPAAQIAGLVWGGHFTTIRDLPHVEVANFHAIAGNPPKTT